MEGRKVKLGLSAKIIAVTVLILTVIVGVNYVLFIDKHKSAMEQALLEEASVFTALADEAKNHSALVLESGAIDSETLLTELKEHIAKGGHYSDTRLYNTIPVVAGWTAAGKAAEREGLEFHVPSFDARNPENEPAQGSFTAVLLRELSQQVASGGQESIGRIDRETNQMHYLRAIRLDQTCMSCHGNPAQYDADGDGKDILGFRMEGWKVGDMHGAYEIVMPLDKMDTQVAGFIQSGMMVTVPLVAVGVGAFIFALRNLLTKPLAMVVTLLQGIATGEGDLTRRLNLSRSDEIGMLGHWFDIFVARIHDTVCRVAGATQEVASAATEIAASSDQIAGGARQQHQQIQQVSAAIEEMSASVVEVARKSGQAAETAQGSGRSAEEGSTVVNETIEGMRAITEAVESSSASVTELGKRGQQIGEIIDVINDIADQTNLLALNAAIEAARAGEHGRGFAVVADEVRKLADRTTKATDEIAESIQSIQSETDEAVKRMSSGTAEVRQGMSRASEAGSSLEKIVASSREVSSMIGSIAAAAEEQSAVAEEVSRNVESIASVTRQTTEGVQQAATAASDLSRKSEELQSLVSQFKVDPALLGKGHRG